MLSAFSRMSRRDRGFEIVRLERMAHERSATIDFDKRLWANLSTAARRTPSFLRAAVAVSSTTCFRVFQPAKVIGFYGPRFSELRYTP
jgi:hypothetical protein